MDILSSDDLFYVMNELKHDDLIQFCQTNRQPEQICSDQQYWRDRVKVKYNKTVLPWGLTWRRFDYLLEQEKIKLIPMVFAENFESTAFEKQLTENNDNGVKIQETVQFALIADDFDYLRNSLFHIMKYVIKKYMMNKDPSFLHYIYLSTTYTGHEYEITVSQHNNVEIGMIVNLIASTFGESHLFDHLKYIAMYSVQLEQETESDED